MIGPGHSITAQELYARLGNASAPVLVDVRRPGPMDTTVIGAVRRALPPLGAALAAITAAVVGVVLNLAVWFALHLWFREAHRAPGLALDVPVWSSVDVWALALSAAAMIAIFRFRAGMIPTLAACSAAGLVLYLMGAIR